MVEPTRSQLEDNYNLLIGIIENTFGESDRTERLLKMYGDLKDRMKYAPASAKEHFHYAFVGGYVKHILHVVEYARKFHKLFEDGVVGGVATFKKYAKDLGLDTGDFDKCLDSGEMASEVSKDMGDGTSVGIKGTPGFVVGTQLISGAQPFSAFEAAIEAQL